MSVNDINDKNDELLTEQERNCIHFVSFLDSLEDKKKDDEGSSGSEESSTGPMDLLSTEELDFEPCIANELSTFNNEVDKMVEETSKPYNCSFCGLETSYKEAILRLLHKNVPIPDLLCASCVEVIVENCSNETRNAYMSFQKFITHSKNEKLDS